MGPAQQKLFEHAKAIQKVTGWSIGKTLEHQRRYVFGEWEAAVKEREKERAEEARLAWHYNKRPAYALTYRDPAAELEKRVKQYMEQTGEASLLKAYKEVHKADKVLSRD